VSDPHCINDLYITKNKFFDKYGRSQTAYYQLFGDSTLHSKSTALWAEKRKKVSAAFYKDKMIGMLQNVIVMAKQFCE
jgi:hypothetical protein